MLTKTSAARPEPADSIPAKINPINLLRIILPSFPNQYDLSSNPPTTVAVQLENQPAESCCFSDRSFRPTMYELVYEAELCDRSRR